MTFLTLLYEHMYEIAAMILFGIGFILLLLSSNMFRKIIGFSMMDNAIYLFLASSGYIAGSRAPILTEGADPAQFVNPLPAGLVLTGIVVSVSVTAIMLALTVRLHRRYGTVDIDEIAEITREEGK